MKKMKKLAALMLSVMTCAASLSAMTSNAALWYVDASNFEEFISNWTAVEVNIGDTLYISKDSRKLILMVNDRVEPKITFDVTEGLDYHELDEIIHEASPNLANCGMCSAIDHKDFKGYGWRVSGKIIDSDANESYQVTLNDAKKLYEAFKEKGWVDKGWIKNLSFSSAHYIYSEGFFEYGYITAYNIENKEILEKYINENELNCHLEEEDFGEDSIVKVVPDYEISSLDHCNLFEQIYKDTGVSQRWLINEDINTLSEGDVDLMNNTPGDANENGELDMADAVLIMQCCSNPDEYRLTAQGRYNADFNNDGITNEDALTVQKILLEIE